MAPGSSAIRLGAAPGIGKHMLVHITARAVLTNVKSCELHCAGQFLSADSSLCLCGHFEQQSELQRLHRLFRHSHYVCSAKYSMVRVPAVSCFWVWAIF